MIWKQANKQHNKLFKFGEPAQKKAWPIITLPSFHMQILGEKTKTSWK